MSCDSPKMPSLQSFLCFISCASLSYFKAEYLNAVQPKEISIIIVHKEQIIKVSISMKSWEV